MSASFSISVAGDQFIGGTLTATPSEALDSQQWTRDGVPIAGATGLTYTLVAADDGTVIRCVGTIGAETVSSNGLVAVYPAPTVLTPASISGEAVETVTLSGFDATFSGSNLTIDREWEVSGDGLNWSGTGVTTLTGPAQVQGQRYRLAVTAANSGGSETSYSDVIGPAVARLVTINGLITNPTHGTTAQHGLQLSISTNFTIASTDWREGSNSLSTTADYTPDATANDLDNLFARVTPVNGQAIDTPAYQIRFAPPQFLTQPAFDAGPFTVGDTVTWTLGTAPVGSDIGIETFTLGGTDKTGELVDSDPGIAGTQDTDWDSTGESDGTLSLRCVILANSGGPQVLSNTVNVALAAASAFSVGNQVFNMGELTNAGDGRYEFSAVNGAIASIGSLSGANAADWNATLNGDTVEITPSATGDTGDLSNSYADLQITVYDGAGQTGASEVVDLSATIQANAAHVSAASEVNAALQEMPLAGGGTIYARDGDSRSDGRQTLAARTFLGETTIRPETWSENTANPKLSTRNCLWPALIIAAGMQFLTVEGFDLYQADGSTNSVITVQRPATEVHIHQCEIHSSPMVDEHAAGRMQAGVSSLLSCFGIRATESGTLTRVRYTQNHIHDVYRGATLDGTVHDNANGPCQINENWFEDCYQYFTQHSGADTQVGTHAMEINDNRGIHVWSTTADAGAPHSSVGLSFNPNINGLRVFGNAVHIGWTRLDVEPAFATGATGAKWNDPTQTDSYRNIEVAFNLIVTRGIAIEFSAADGIDVFNNTVIRDSYHNSGSSAVIYFQGAANVRMWDNIANAYNIGANDNGTEGGVPLVETLATLQGYGNIKVTPGRDDFFAGNASPGLGVGEITIEDLATAYVPAAGEYAITASRGKGALGTGLYSGGGVHTNPWSSPVPTAGAENGSRTGVVFPGDANYVFDGTNPFSNNVPGNMPLTQLCGALDFKPGVGTNGSQMTFYGTANPELQIYRDSSNKMHIVLENDSSGQMFNIQTNFEILEDVRTTILWAIDTQAMVAWVVKDGVQDIWIADYDMEVGSSTPSANERVMSGWGNSEYVDAVVYEQIMTIGWVDWDDQAEVERVLAPNGRLQDMGATGVNFTGTQPLLHAIGPAASWGNTNTNYPLTVVNAGSGLTDESTGAATLSGFSVTNNNDGTGDFALTIDQDATVTFWIGTGTVPTDPADIIAGTGADATIVQAVTVGGGPYTLTIPSGLDGTYNIGAAATGSNVVSDTGIAIDTTVPGILSLSPADDSLTVDPASDLVITFTEGMDTTPPDPAVLTLHLTSDDSVVETFDIDAGDGTWSTATEANDRLTLSPAANLLSSTAYYVNLSGFRDDSGNPLGGIADTTTWNFTTSAGGGPFDPTQDPALNLWVDFSDETTITDTAGEVTAVANKATGGDALTIGGSPETGNAANDINGLNVLLFNDADDDDLEANITLAADGDALFITLIEMTGGAGTRSVFSINGASNDMQMEADGGLNASGAFSSGQMSGGVLYEAPRDPRLGVLAVVFDKTGTNTVKAFFNGVEEFSTTYNNNLDVAQVFRIMANRSGSVHGAGRMGEFIVSDDPSLFSDYNTYLTDKWIA